MIEAIREGKPASIEEYQRLAEADPNFTWQANEAKKEWRRKQPKVYRNGTGKGYWQEINEQQIIESHFHPDDLLDDKEHEELAESMK